MAEGQAVKSCRFLLVLLLLFTVIHHTAWVRRFQNSSSCGCWFGFTQFSWYSETQRERSKKLLNHFQTLPDILLGSYLCRTHKTRAQPKAKAWLCITWTLPHSPRGAPLCSSLRGFGAALLILLSFSCSLPSGQEHPQAKALSFPIPLCFLSRSGGPQATPGSSGRTFKETRGQLS